MTLLYQVGLLLLVAASFKVSAECCTPGATSDFCTVFSMLSTMEQNEVMSYLGENCEGDADVALQKMEKRKPNFMRYGRSAAVKSLGKKAGSDPNFLRFGRSQPNFLRFGKASGDPNFLRFGRSDPNFLRFGKIRKAIGGSKLLEVTGRQLLYACHIVCLKRAHGAGGNALCHQAAVGATRWFNPVAGIFVFYRLFSSKSKFSDSAARRSTTSTASP
ncbi:Protein CBR-FLP-1 [Caenorhabditis briggsae]|uniref:Protein CBR-FLP-1 n=1 Tax=Caenorhabditis briggsae TaxID=6238 RepID=A8Y0H9_CAEBR|nr:Protein CBR-FLP-1 [Caenorhabditis briggsae]CAP38397.2 Protein CBR-FLP-1 [Caenorhabditis briggsae]